MTMLHSLIARRWFGPQTQWRPLHKALMSGLGLDDLSLAWHWLSSKAEVPVLFLILWSFVVYTTGCLMFLSLLVLFVLVSPFVLAFWSPRLEKRELVFVLLVHLFVCFARVYFVLFLFLLVSRVGCGLWLRHTLDLFINFFAVRMKTVGFLAIRWAHSEDSDQTGQMPRLIWVFAGRTYHFVGFVMGQLNLSL